MIYHSLIDLIGRTPVLELHRFQDKFGLNAHIFAKLECCNPAGSAKDRVAAEMIAAAETANGAKFGTTADSSEVYSPTINIYTQPNQNSTEIANMVERKLVQMNKQRKLGALT